MNHNDWVSGTLGDFVTLRRGHDLPKYKRNPGTVPVLGSFGITGFHDQAIAHGPGVTIGRSGASIGVANYTPKDYWPLNTVLYVTDFHGNDERFAYYFLKSIDFRRFNSGSAQPSLNRNYIHPLLIEIPNIDEQQAIASVLGSLDDKIELNRQMNQTLEAIARAIFKSWFVDFDPVWAKMEGRDYPLDAETMDLFPDHFEDSELGEIPAGWEIGRVDDLGEVICGKTPPTKEQDNYGGDIPFIKIPDMRTNVFVTETEKTLSEKGARTQAKKLLPAKTVCVSCIATPGLVALTSRPSHTNQQINSVITNKKSNPYYSYFALKNISKKIVIHGSGGSVYSNLSKSRFSSLKLLIPPTLLTATYEQIVDSLFDLILLQGHETRTLTELRDTLLPKLISGELRVLEAAEMVEV